MILESLMLGDLIALRYLNNKRLMSKPVGDYELKIGYKGGLLYNKPITVNMRRTPHLFICGLSGSGKSKLAEYALRGKRVKLVNVFEEDFKTLEGERITGNENILKFLNELLEGIRRREKEEKPLYILIDELLVLCIDKAITKAITDILAIGRHYNIFLVGISQIGTKEAVKFKDLFNTRICFRQVEESSYRAILGYSPEDKQLKQREFYLYSEEIARGRSYTVN